MHQANGNGASLDPLERAAAIAQAASKAARQIEKLPDDAARITAAQTALDYFKAAKR
jgi:hypothetical protein